MQIKENETVLENRKRTKKNLQAYRYSVQAGAVQGEGQGGLEAPQNFSDLN